MTGQCVYTWKCSSMSSHRLHGLLLIQQTKGFTLQDSLLPFINLRIRKMKYVTKAEEGGPSYISAEMQSALQQNCNLNDENYLSSL